MTPNNGFTRLRIFYLSLKNVIISSGTRRHLHMERGKHALPRTLAHSHKIADVSEEQIRSNQFLCLLLSTNMMYVTHARHKAIDQPKSRAIHENQVRWLISSLDTEGT